MIPKVQLPASRTMSSWVRRAEPGSPAGIFDIGTMYRRPAEITSQLLVGDETALPAILAILDRTPPAVSTEVLVEVADAADIRDDPRIRWFSRDGRRPGDLVVDAVRRADLPTGRFYTWVAGESRLATSVRRHLVNDRGVAKRDVSFFGYWRLGRSAPG